MKITEHEVSWVPAAVVIIMVVAVHSWRALVTAGIFAGAYYLAHFVYWRSLRWEKDALRVYEGYRKIPASEWHRRIAGGCLTPCRLCDWELSEKRPARFIWEALSRIRQIFQDVGLTNAIIRKASPGEKIALYAKRDEILRMYAEGGLVSVYSLSTAMDHNERKICDKVLSQILEDEHEALAWE